MSHSLQHAFEAEEVMAYLDGALEAERAAALAAHLDGCGECQALAKSFRQLTDRMMSFEVEPAPNSMNDAVLAALEKPAATAPTSAKPAIWMRFDIRNWPLVQRVPRNWATIGGLALAALIASMVVVPRLHRRAMDVESVPHYLPPSSQFAAAQQDEVKPEAPPPAPQRLPSDITRGYQEALQRKEEAALTENLERSNVDKYVATVSESSDDQSGESTLAAPDVKGPMIEQNVSLHIVPSNYDDASAAIEKMAAAHGGYVGNLTASAQTGSARDISVELRIPAKQADAFIADVRKLGKVVDESRAAEEVTAEYVDLQARLRASKAAEQRLVELLGNRTGKLSDVLEVERELARVRSEIESMQGQSNLMLHEVNYATVKVELSEEYHETLRSDSIPAKIRNAFVGGVKNLEDGIVGAIIFVLKDGLSLAFWAAVILAIALLVRKRIRSRRAASAVAGATK
jgi:hypothetical protein